VRDKVIAMGGTRVPHVLGADDNMLDPDPRVVQALMDRLRAQGHEVVTDDAGMIVWFLTTDDAEHLLTAPEFSSGVAMAMLHLSGVNDGPLHELWSDLIFGKDGDDHRRLRQSVARRLTPKAVDRLRPTIERTSDELLSSWAPGSVVDVWESFAVPLPARSACALVGIPDDDASRFAEWALQLVRAFGLLDPDAVGPTTTAAAELVAYLDELITSGLAPDGSILHALTADDSHGLTSGELRGLAGNLVFGGIDATAKAITTGLAHLLETPHAWTALTADPAGAAPGAVAELLRFYPPVAGTVRLPVKPATCRGTDVDAGQVVGVSFDPVCKDPHHVDRPDELDITRTPGKQYAFGAGPHYCLGANLARLVLETGFRDLAARYPTLRLARDPATAPWTQDPFRGIVELPVHVPES
jgi:cytochrome P450